MIGRLFRWWRKRKLLKTGGLLRFYDGRRWRYGDPFAIWRVLQNQPTTMQVGYLEQFIPTGKEPECSQLIELTCQAFGATRFDPQTEQGLTDSEVIQLLFTFARYVADVKKNISPGPISPGPTDSESSASPEPPSEPMSACSDSSCACGEPRPDAAGP